MQNLSLTTVKIEKNDLKALKTLSILNENKSLDKIISELIKDEFEKIGKKVIYETITKNEENIKKEA